MTAINLEELKRLAEAVPQREWFVDGNKLKASFGLNTSEVIFDMNIGRGDIEWMDRRIAELKYIAYANPQTILSLIRELEEASRIIRGLVALSHPGCTGMWDDARAFIDAARHQKG